MFALLSEKLEFGGFQKIVVPVGLDLFFRLKQSICSRKKVKKRPQFYLRGCKLSTQAKDRDETSPSL